jgi:hypothetical protein
MTYRPTKTIAKYFNLTATVGSYPLLLSQKYGRSLRMLRSTIPSGWQLSVARWVNQPLTVLCYQSQISKFLRKNRRNQNLKQDSESSSQPRLRIWVYPELVGGITSRALHRAVTEQVPVSWEEFGESVQCWIEANAYPSTAGVAVYF